MNDVARLWSLGYALGASFENSIVFDDTSMLNTEGLRYADECVRHKVLDAIGDLALAGLPLLGAYRSVRGGHKLNHAVLTALLADPQRLAGGRGRAGAAAARSRRSRHRPGRRHGGAGLRPGRVLTLRHPFRRRRFDHAPLRPSARLALFPAKCLRTRLVDRPFWATQPAVARSSFGSRSMVQSMTAFMDQRRGPCITGVRIDIMSAQRLTFGLREHVVQPEERRLGRALRLSPACCVLALPLGGCGTGALWDKFLAKDETYTDEPADKLYNEGLYLMNQSKDPKAASKKFEEVDRQHPYSDWARKSLLMSAYAYYEAGDYDNCIGSATRYVTLHPGSPDAAYAQYLIAASHYDQIPDISRDQGRTEKAIAALEEVIRKYPTSEYANSAKKKLEGARDQLAGKEMDGRPLLHGASATTPPRSTASRPW